MSEINLFLKILSRIYPYIFNTVSGLAAWLYYLTGPNQISLMHLVLFFKADIWGEKRIILFLFKL